MKKYILPIILVLALAGCSTTSPTPTGTVTSTGVAVSSTDPVVIAEITAQIAYDTFDALFALELQNHALVKQYAPAVGVEVNKLRAEAPQWLATLRAMTKAYEASATPGNLINLQTAVALVNQGLIEAQQYGVQISALK